MNIFQNVKCNVLPLSPIRPKTPNFPGKPFGPKNKILNINLLNKYSIKNIYNLWVS